MPFTGTLGRVVVAIVVGIVTSFLVWLVGWVVEKPLGVNGTIEELGRIVQNISFIAGVLAALWVFVTGHRFILK